MTKLEQELTEVLSKVANDLKCMGNGYGWAVEEVMESILPVLEANVPGFQAKNIVVDCKDF